jgi:hypothetical protein
MRSQPLSTGRSTDLTRGRLVEDAIAMPHGGAPVLGLDKQVLPRSFVAARAASSAADADALARLTEENRDLVMYGEEELHLHYDHPLRSIDLPDEVVMLSAFNGGEGLQILESRWPVVRGGGGKTELLLSAGVLDELPLPTSSAAVTKELRRLAAATNFVPRKGFRVALLISPRAEREMPGVTDQLVVAGAVAGGDVRVPTIGDLNDEAELRRLARFATDNRHQAVFSLSMNGEAWIRRVRGEFERERERRKKADLQGVPWTLLHNLDVATAVEQFDDCIANAVAMAPKYPLFTWGEEALARVIAYEGSAFQVSDRAKKHLRRNTYPNVERMLEHLELLARGAQRWHEENTGGIRLEDWFLENYQLDIALADKGLPAGWSVPYKKDGQNPRDLDAQPHVRVDDATDRLHCGRIYFGLEGAERVVVLGYVGSHP